MSAGEEHWVIVEAKRDDGTPTMFRIRELDPIKTLDKIFVVEMPYPATELSRLPNAASYRRLADFDEQWLRPACTSLGWELVGSKTEDGSFFLYMYGAGDPNDLIAKLSPFDANLGFYDDADPDWLEYATLRELLDQAKAIPQPRDSLAPSVPHVAANVADAVTEPVRTRRRAPRATSPQPSRAARTTARPKKRAKSATRARTAAKRAKPPTKKPAKAAARSRRRATK